jgi:hypothetical protein
MAASLRVIEITVALSLAMSVCVAPSASAQASEPRLAVNHATPLPTIWSTSPSVVRVYDDDESASPRVKSLPLPPNLTMSEPMRVIAAAMLEQSPTFRRQCARLANARQLTVVVDNLAVQAPGLSRAYTTFAVGAGGRLVARVHLPPSIERDELLAHEIEHVIEQLDGVDLPAMSARDSTGVQVSLESGRFETQRAVTIGRQVAEEIRRAQRRDE